MTKNYLSVLSEMEVERKEVEAIGNPEHGTRIQISPVTTRIPEKVANLKSTAHSFRECHTKVENRSEQSDLARWES